LFDKITEELKYENKKDKKSKKIFKKGDEVHVISKDVDGIIVDKSNNEGQYLVQVGILKINFDSDDLSLKKSKIKTEKALNYYSDMPKAQITLDLRGYRYEDAERKIDKFIEEALINKTEIIKIIHGKGTGALRNCIQDYLKNCPFVVEYNYEKLVSSNETNFGVTIARLRR
jgi:DNA mismatch repair protein MutS2